MLGETVHIVIGVSDAQASADHEDSLVTYSLGSCVGVTLYDAKAGVGGLLHFQLPCSSADPGRAAERPLMYADTGMAQLMAKMVGLGADKRRMRVRMAGGAQMLNDGGIFDIGRRNHAAIRKIFWKYGMFIDAEHVGGKLPRTMLLNVGDGSLTIKCNNEIITL